MSNIVFNYDKLKEKISEVFKSKSAYAHWLGITETSLNNKLNSNSYFNQDQIIRTVDYIGAKKDEVVAYFFTLEVEKNTINLKDNKGDKK